MNKNLSEIKHLNEEAKSVLLLSNEDRIEYVNTERWIGYGKALEILVRMEKLINLPRKDRMPNLLIIGDTNNGKTVILNRFINKHPIDENPDGDAKIIPVISVQASPNADEGRFYSNILRKLGAPFRDSDRPSGKWSQILTISEKVNLRLLIIDEIHDIIAGGSNKQIVFRNAIKQLGTELKISIVASGTIEALNAIKTDPQLSNRFHTVFLPLWDIGLKTDSDNAFLKLLSSYERMLPLWKPSFLTKRNISIKLLSMSGGLIGELSNILTEATEYAILNGKEQINMEVLNKLNWVMPSERNI